MRTYVTPKRIQGRSTFYCNDQNQNHFLNRSKSFCPFACLPARLSLHFCVQATGYNSWDILMKIFICRGVQKIDPRGPNSLRYIFLPIYYYKPIFTMKLWKFDLFTIFSHERLYDGGGGVSTSRSKFFIPI